MMSPSLTLHPEPSLAEAATERGAVQLAAASSRTTSRRLIKWFLLVVLLLGACTWWGLRWIELATQPEAQIDLPAVEADWEPQVRIAMKDPQRKLDVSFDKARELNAAIPLSTAAIVIAKPYVFAGSQDDHERAAACLAAAVFYEAGDDLIGQRAVAQVVLNRTLHRVFPKSVCGVVFQGSERRTGCQFSFTCDGSISRRKPTAAQWGRARTVAYGALDGAIYAPVGLATHYHTDWVVPYWSGSMEKIAKVGTHLFFRWRGDTGSLAAFGAARGNPEVLDSRLAAVRGPALQDSHEGLAPKIVPLPLDSDVAGADSGRVETVAAVSHDRLLRIDAAASPAGIVAAALRLCQGAAKCQVYGYVGGVPDRGWASISHANFYFDGGSTGSKQVYWDCRRFYRQTPTECLPGTTSQASVANAVAPKEG